MRTCFGQSGEDTYPQRFAAPFGGTLFILLTIPGEPKSGKVKISKIGLDGKEQTIRFLKKGDVAGYRALISSERYQASAIALEDSEVCFFQKNIVNPILKDDNLVRNEIIKLMSDDIKLAEQKIVD